MLISGAQESWASMTITPRLKGVAMHDSQQMLGKAKFGTYKSLPFLFLGKACIANRGLLVIDVNQWNTLKITKNIEAW